MIDTDQQDGKMLQRLATELHNRRTGRSGTRRYDRGLLRRQSIRPPLELLQAYVEGNPPLREDIHSGWQPHVLQFIRMGRLNVADQLISTTANRLQLTGFRTSAVDDDLGDVEARKIMRANNFSVLLREVLDMSLTMGESYMLVTPPGKTRATPLITAEDPRQTIVATDAATGEPIAGLKLFRSDWDVEDLAYLFLPGRVRVARKKGRTTITNGPARFNSSAWDWDDRLTQHVPANLFPLVPFTNRRGVGEFEAHLDTLDRINDKIFDEWWVAKIQAFRQRAVKGLPDTEEVEGEDGELIEVPVPEGAYDDIFMASPAEMWQVPADVEFWESTPVDLTPITNAIEKDRSRLASTLSVPLNTITPDAASGSAEGAALMREEHSFKCEDRRDRYTWPAAKVMSLAFAFAGDHARADITQIDPQWAPVVRYSLSEKADASSKAQDLPVDVRRRDIWQYDPAEVLNMRGLDGQDLMLRPPRDTTATA